MPIREEMRPAGIGRRMMSISTRKAGQDPHKAAAVFWHRHGSSYIRINDRADSSSVSINGKEDILRLEQLIKHVKRLKGW